MSIYEEGLAEAYVRIRSKGDSGTEWVTAVRRSNGEVSVLCGEHRTGSWLSGTEQFWRLLEKTRNKVRGIC
jgi:hypothetical protein